MYVYGTAMNTNATKTDRLAELDAAREQWTRARTERACATTRQAKRDADEAVNFWSNRMAMLSVPKGWAE